MVALVSCENPDLRMLQQSKNDIMCANDRIIVYCPSIGELDCALLLDLYNNQVGSR